MFYLCFFQAEDGIRDLVRSRGLGDVYKRQVNWRTIGFIQGNGTTTEYHRYEFTDYDLQPGEYLSLIHI